MNSLTNIPLPTSSNVLLIGDSCTDIYDIGTVDRLSPEAPVPILKIIENYEVCGMSANVNLNLINLNIYADFVTNSKQIIKRRFIDKRSGQHLLRVDDTDIVDRWNKTLPASLDKYDAIVISDYNKGFVQYEDIEHIVKEAKCPVFIDTKKQDLSRFRADHCYVKINETEYKNRFSIPKNLIVTLGDRGAQYKDKLYPTKRVEVMDVCGCGDTFLAALAYQYLCTTNIEKAIIFANMAASITVQHRGNYAPTYNEIINA